MKSLKNHIILSLIALISTNMYFVLWLLIDETASRTQIIDDMSFFQFMGITNGALIVISMFSITYKNLGDRMLAWGYSNVFRFAFLLVVSILIFVVANVLLFFAHFALTGANELTDSVVDAINNTYFLPLVFFFSLVSILMFFISNLERRSGNVFRLMAQSMGNSLRPQLVERGFMFIDLNDATNLAEQMSSENYAKLLRDCFRMLNELIDVYPFEIYQFVGDEAVITWKADIEKAEVMALDLFSDFKAYLAERTGHFKNNYNTQPQFKCAIHFGEVVQSEIGKEIKHLVYHGDVLNTTSRLLSKCHIQTTDLIISEEAISNLEVVRSKYTLTKATYTNLKGKEKPINAYTVNPKMKSSIILKKTNKSFSAQKVTNGHLLLNLNTMKTIRKATALAFAGAVLLACGGEENKTESDSAQPEEQATMATSKSTVQVIRKSDLELQTVKNTTVQSFIPITGRVVPKNTTQLVAEVQGRIMAQGKPFKAGTRYIKGQTILRMDSREFALNLESQKSAFLNILTGMMPDLKADYPENYQTWLNYVNNYQTGKSLPELPATASNPEKYFLTSRQVYNTYYNIKAQEERLNKYIIRAPFTGSLSQALVDNGGLVSPGQPLGTFISDNNYEVEAAVSIQLAKSLKIGQKIDFFSSSLNKGFEAKITRMNNIIDPETQNIPVFLSIRDKDLKSGMYLEGQVSASSFDNAFKIPSTALNRDNTVHILQNGVIKKETVKILNSGTKEVVIQGLTDNSQLIVTTFQNPVSGLKITE
ncbi:MAG: hypothetical protein Mars2KO_42470 [Maribacter sp.]